MPKKNGRPKIKISWAEMEKLCSLQCTLIEISNWFKCSEDTIERRCKEKHGITFAEYYKKNSAGGKISLRRHQVKAAEAGSVPMLIWLGKQHLGQTDRQELDLNHNVVKRIKKRFDGE